MLYNNGHKMVRKGTEWDIDWSKLGEIFVENWQFASEGKGPDYQNTRLCLA